MSAEGSPIVEETSFSLVYPQNREKYILDVWKFVVAELKRHEIVAEIDKDETSITVSNTKRTTDPYVILRAKDFVKLMCRGMDFQNALKILDENTVCEVIKINVIKNKDRFLRRRDRLVGPSGNTTRALELVTNTKICIYGTTVGVVGSERGVRDVRRVVLDCMNNVHPVYRIKELVVKRELSKDEKLKNESWDKFIPKYKKRNIKSSISKKKKEYTPFPPERDN